MHKFYFKGFCPADNVLQSYDWQKTQHKARRKIWSSLTFPADHPSLFADGEFITAPFFIGEVAKVTQRCYICWTKRRLYRLTNIDFHTSSTRRNFWPFLRRNCIRLRNLIKQELRAVNYAVALDLDKKLLIKYLAFVT